MAKKLAVAMLLFLFVFSGQAFASTQPIIVKVDGVDIKTDQQPIIINNRTLVPLRAIFEALNASVHYDDATKTITAIKGNTTIVLVIGSNRALINNKATTLEVPAQIIGTRTMVPVRFVSEALGDDVNYNPSTREVLIKTKALTISNIVARDINDFGDGRDLEISFNRADDESTVNHYRIMVVKSSKANSFNLTAANRVSSNHYTTVPKEGRNIKRTLTANSVDTDGQLIQSDISYSVFVLSVSNNSSSNFLLKADREITLTQRYNAAAVTNLSLKDVSDYGDGRDIEVSFTRASDENRVSQYRVIVVRADEVRNMTVSEAKELPAANYTVVHKTGGNIKHVLSFNTRDSEGRLIQSGSPYRVYVLSLGDISKGFGSSISSQSQEIVLYPNPEEIRVTNVSLKDVADFGDGRDLQVNFSIPNNETRVTEYRVMVVPSNEASSFNMNKAINLSSSNYTSVSKTGANISTTLPSTARDVNGYQIRNGSAYRVFVLSVGGAANYNLNSLSAASGAITLTENFKIAAVTNIKVSDISDFGDGRDLEVTFNKVADETGVASYRIFVVKSAQAAGFTLAHANSISSANYTAVPKTGTNLSTVLRSTSRDAYGDLIREGVDYRVFVLTVSGTSNNDNNMLSAPTAVFKLAVNATTTAPTNVTGSDVGNAGDGSDLEVKFNKVNNESYVSEYRIMVVKAANIDRKSVV